MKFAQIPCQKQKHQQMKLQYICLHDRCIKHNNILGCIHCGQDQHRQHLQNFLSIKTFMNRMNADLVKNNNEQNNIRLQRLIYKKKQLSNMIKDIDQEIKKIRRESVPDKSSKIKDALLANLQICKTQQSFKQNLYELIFLQRNQPNQKLVNKQMTELRKFANQFQNSKGSEQKQEGSTIKQIDDDQLLIKPIFTFKKSDQYSLVTPYSIKSIKNGFCSILAHPSLNTFSESVQFSFHIKKLKPNWLGVGISRNKKNFNLNQKGFFLWVSNGWFFKDGNKQQSTNKFTVNDKISVRYDKYKKIIIFWKNGKAYQPKLLQIQQQLWNQLHPCVVFFHNGDVVDIIQ